MAVDPRIFSRHRRSASAELRGHPPHAPPPDTHVPVGAVGRARMASDGEDSATSAVKGSGARVGSVAFLDARHARVAAFVEEQMRSNDASHDFEHVCRVLRVAQRIAEAEEYTAEQMDAVTFGALLHDVADHKYVDNPEGPIAEMERLLSELGVPRSTIEEVRYIVENLSYTREVAAEAAGEKLRATPAFAAVQDADRLDAIGAVGVARCLTFGGAKTRALYDPSSPGPPAEGGGGAGRRDTLAHFYEKLLGLEDRMKTGAGRRLAGERTAFMRRFLEQFWGEVAGAR